MKYVYYLLVLCILSSCTSKKNTDDPVLAKVFDEVLYLSEIKEVVPEGIDIHDSVQIAKSHIEKWVRNNLLLNLAEQHLSDEEKNVEQQIEDYRSSLLIFKFKQNFITQKLDTIINEKDIEDYYNNFSSNFLLTNHLIQGIFLRIPRSAPQLYKVRNWCTSDKQEHLKELEEYCFNNGAEFDYFDETWRPFSEVAMKFPKRYSGYNRILDKYKFYETYDSTYSYYLKISDYRLEGMVSPMELVYDDLRNILLNKRKLEIIQELESNVYNDALNRGYFLVYN